MTPTRFCPKCGATDKKLFNGFCVDCYLADHPDMIAVPGKLEMSYCPQCLRFLVKGEWQSGDEEIIEAFINSKVRTQVDNPSISLELLSDDGKKKAYRVIVEGALSGQDIMLEKETLLKMAKKQCPVCGRKDSTYYEALVQLRPKGNEIDLERLKSALNFLRNQNRALVRAHREAEVFRFERVKNGIDVYFGSAKAAKKALQYLARTYACEVKASHTLVGLDKTSGKRRYKTTYAVRL